MSAVSEGRKLEMALYEKEFLLNRSKLISVERVTWNCWFTFSCQEQYLCKKDISFKQGFTLLLPLTERNIFEMFPKKAGVC